MRKKPDGWHQKDVHHIIGQCHKEFNTNNSVNKIIVDKSKHKALNTLVNDKQSPKEQLYVLFTEWWYPVLSDTVRGEILKILDMPDNEFYIKWLLKKWK